MQLYPVSTFQLVQSSLGSAGGCLPLRNNLFFCHLCICCWIEWVLNIIKWSACGFVMVRRWLLVFWFGWQPSQHVLVNFGIAGCNGEKAIVLLFLLSFQTFYHTGVSFIFFCYFYVFMAHLTLLSSFTNWILNHKSLALRVEVVRQNL